MLYNDTIIKLYPALDRFIEHICDRPKIILAYCYIITWAPPNIQTSYSYIMCLNLNNKSG